MAESMLSTAIPARRSGVLIPVHLYGLRRPSATTAHGFISARESNILFALNTSNGAEIWRFTGAAGDINSPIRIDLNGHIYFGSDDDNVYALYPDGTQKWSFTTAGNVEVQPAVKADGTVYAGSNDGNLYSIKQTTNPVNLKDLLITSSGQSVGGVPVTIDSEADWLKGSSSKGPWAVRLEIARSQVQAGEPMPTI